ncbi:hypothetical protein [Actinomycetospora cinnamomea]|uniref:Uncharacterized protein n=1 Tax=Actinomycetospora cinnamomea TaxID=663609 RepID=A0A2U1F6R3_9PSEU|nr:hypothetical protein [Actinomycetospora cinnamomea]PVZ07859.1 hypothetical protein C8D89_11012 [Actinomycetospora cinnamomea]
MTARLDTVATIGAEVIATLRSQPVSNPALPPKSMQLEATGEQQPVLLGIADRGVDLDKKSDELLVFAQDHFPVLLGLSLAQLGDFCEETGARLEMVRRNCGEVQDIIGDAVQQARRNELHRK